MGRHDLRPLRIHQTANQLLASERISSLPNWHGVVGAIPPAQTLVRTQPLQHNQRPRTRTKARKASKLFQPTKIGYEEDKLRRNFFGDHPWELARPRVVLESDGKDYEENDWSRISQPGRGLSGESVIQRQMWLQENVPSISPATAYDQARKEFYKLRLQEDVQRRVAQEEALSTGAYFHKSTMEVGMELEDRQYEEWKAWAVKEVALAEQRRNAMYTGQESQSTDLSPEEEEAAVDEVGDAVPAQGQSAAGGATVIPAPQGPGVIEGHVGEFDYPTGHGELSQDLYLDLPSTAAGYGAVGVFTEAVEKARQGIKQNLVGSGEVSETVNLKLSIDLKSKGLEDLPDEVVDIVKRDVESLKLDYNHIWHIPYKFDECVMLKYLNLRNNRFKDFPKALYRLPRLEVLDLSRNKLVRISEDIKNMRALRVLSLGNNMIENLPPIVASLDIRILKLAGNPLNPDLMKVVDGGTVSPSYGALPDNERDVIVTRKIKKYLRSVETAARDSGGESSDETVSTPRAPRRTLSHRFPVKPNTSESESASDINLTMRSPSFAKPPIPARSHYRVTSGLQDGPLNPIRRPGLAPFLNGNERNRSNSESVLQATQNNRNKRMGMVTRKQNDPGTLDERANRNSFHSRGQSDGSSLSDRYNKTVRNNEVNPPSPLRSDRQQGLFVRRLSSLPEQKRESKAPDRLVESAKGVLYSIHLVHPHLATLIPVVKEKPVKNRSGLEKIYRYASNQLKVLDSALHELDNRIKMKGDGKQTRNTDALCACEALMMTYQQLGEYLLCNANRLVSGGDQRYVRTLFLLLYGSVTEGRNAIWNLISTFVEQSLRRSSRTQTDTIHEEPHRPRDRSLTPTNQRPNPERRQRIGIPMQPPATMISLSPASGVQTAVPLYVNGRSRSNSRAGPFVPSNTSSVANTPRSGESFMLSGHGTPKLRSRSNSALGQHVQNVAQIPESPEQEALFEKIFISLSRCVEQSQRIIPVCLLQFTGCLDVAHMSFTSQRIHLLWSTLISRCNVSFETSTAVQKRLSAIKLHEPDIRHSKEFWRLCSKLLLSLEKLMSGVRDAKLLELISTELLKNIHPLQKSLSQTGRYIKSSPWEHLTRDTNTAKSNPDAATAHAQNQHAIYQNQDGSYRHRARTGSGNSPYPTNVPATPLSAALGPAAQATVPTSAAFDRTFAGDVFQRADELLRVQQTMVHRR